MHKRIVIHEGRDNIAVAINTEQGTTLDSLIIARSYLAAKAAVLGYLALYEGSIEIGPRSVKAWNNINEKCT